MTGRALLLDDSRRMFPRKIILGASELSGEDSPSVWDAPSNQRRARMDQERGRRGNSLALPLEQVCFLPLLPCVSDSGFFAWGLGDLHGWCLQLLVLRAAPSASLGLKLLAS